METWKILVAWLVILLELISPIPAFLTFGAIAVLLLRPAWFREFVRALYEG